MPAIFRAEGRPGAVRKPGNGTRASPRGPSPSSARFESPGAKIDGRYRTTLRRRLRESSMTSVTPAPSQMAPCSPRIIFRSCSIGCSTTLFSSGLRAGRAKPSRGPPGERSGWVHGATAASLRRAPARARIALGTRSSRRKRREDPRLPWSSPRFFQASPRDRGDSARNRRGAPPKERIAWRR